MDGRQPGDLGTNLVDRLEPEIVSQPKCDLGRDHPVVAGGTRRSDLLAKRRDSTFEVRERTADLGGTGRSEHHVGVAHRVGDEQVDRDERLDGIERLPRERGIGEVAQRVGTEQNERGDVARSRRLEDARGIEPRRRRHVRPRPDERVATRGEGGAPRQQARRKPHVERSVHVAAPQRTEEPRPGDTVTQGRRGVGDGTGAFCERRPTQDHGDRPTCAQHLGRGSDRRRLDTRNSAGRRRIGDERESELAHFAGARVQPMRGDLRQARRTRCQLDERGAVLDDRVTQAQVERPQLLFRVRAEQHDDATWRAGVVDRGARQPQHEIGRQTVTQLTVDVVGAEHALGELGPCVRSLIGEPGPAQHCDARGVGVGQGAGCDAERLGPGRADEVLALGVGLAECAPSKEGLVQSLRVVEGLEAEPLLVAQPAPVHRVTVNTHEP